ncbi:uncharacterized protein Z518_01805 [Rhinocladiella mackenziei CBS 650.93]|uniref:Uncharacterized protein n=1 Tax=Rhinocladiella mackenziei CBS 650.93 TaxID=1442369 RepID=A0A0D2J4S0_9EURO|nr:uncharacterized protein Z518_01805 [Rhinocladiella mackenziei CBS 650.93]KIX10721.1 hypothetical protein Z518_01805 [Rhinocladiella mackenziei CBS 650.93]
MNFYHDPERGVAICIRCQTGMVPDGKIPFKNHLRESPHHLKGEAFKATCAYLDRLELTPTRQVRHPPPSEQPIPAIPHLRVYRGYRCLHCDDGLSVSEERTRRHVTSRHGPAPFGEGPLDDRYETCWLQTIFRPARLVRYFRVTPRVDEETRLSISPESSSSSSHAFLTRQRQIHQEIIAVERQQADLVVGSQGHPADVPLWVQSCGFARHLQGCRKTELRALSKKPSTEATTITTTTSEAGLNQIRQVVADLLNETWRWCGFRPGIEAATKNQYIATWQGAITFLWRTEILEGWPTRCIEEEGKKKEMIDREFFRCTDEQRRHLHACVDAVQQKREDETSLREHVAALNMALICHRLFGYRFESALLAFCATLTPRAYTDDWHSASDFNHHLSALIYCGQLWIFRLVCQRVDEDPQLDPDEELSRLCQQWLRQERSTPFGLILNWRLMLFEVGRRDVAPRLATWSLDNQEVCYQGTTISMTQVGQVHRQAVTEARQILERDLLLGADHLVRMSATHLADEAHRREVHWWFAQDRRNERVLQGHREALLQHTVRTPLLHQTYLERHSDSIRFRPEAIGLYAAAMQDFLQRCFAAFHLSGPPLRARDVLAMTWRNTERPRSIYVQHGRVMVYVNHHKSQGHWNGSHDNVRFLPVELGDRHRGNFD